MLVTIGITEEQRARMCLAMAFAWQRWGVLSPMNMGISAPWLTLTQLNVSIHVTML